MPANVSVQSTPNPNAMKFSLDRPVIDGTSRTFANAEDAATNPIAEKLFSIKGVKQVFLLGSFVTVTKQTEAFWPDVAPEIEVALRNHFE